MRYKHTKEELELHIKDCLSISQLCRKLGIIPKGGNYKTLKSKIRKWKLDISHFTGQGWNVGDRYKDIKRKIPLNEILVENSTYTNSNLLKNRLLKENLKEYKCECCKLTEWMGQPIKLELHHRNGDNFNHLLENLELLCPNCHSYTHNYRGKNIKMLV